MVDAVSCALWSSPVDELVAEGQSHHDDEREQHQEGGPRAAHHLHEDGSGGAEPVRVARQVRQEHDAGKADLRPEYPTEAMTHTTARPSLSRHTAGTTYQMVDCICEKILCTDEIHFGDIEL